jgi:tetratricopeptide (TPR) repeat protein
MIDLGDALQGLGKREEAESFFRLATAVSSNEWRCWASLGNHLANDTGSLFPEGPHGREIFQALMSSQQEASAYQPPAESLKRLEAEVNEAARCYERAVALAPREPELYLQRAGYVCASNMIDCLIRHYRNNEAIDLKDWLLASWSQKTVADLH